MLTFDTISGSHKLDRPVWYGISNRLLFPGLSTSDYLEALFKTSAQIIQWREKDLPREENAVHVRKGVQLARLAGKVFIVNGDVQLALEAGADGAHLTSRQAPDLARELLNRESSGKLILGQSVHSERSARAAIGGGCDYLLLGPVYDPISKTAYRRPLGLKGLQEVVELSPVPVFALGGLNRDRAVEVVAAGTAGVAGISWVHLEVEAITGIHSSLGAPSP